MEELNGERVAEERNGLIRWLRPEYQTPDQARPTQTTLEGVGVEEETAIIAPVEQQKWPTQLKLNSSPSATYSAPADANGQTYKSPANSPDATPRKN